LEKNVKSEELKVGVIGLGKMGVMHACLLNTFPNVKVAALCDKSQLMRILAKRVFGDCLVTGQLEDLANLNLAAIYILTPIPSHYSIIKKIIELNIAPNLFVEKTLTSNFVQSKELYTLKRNHQNTNMVGYMKRFGVTFNKAKTLLDQQILGQLIFFDAYAFSSDFADLPEGSLVSAARGGALEDLGSHVADLALWYFGDLNVTSANTDFKIAQNSADSVNFEVAGPNLLKGKFSVSWSKKGYHMPEFGLKIEGTAGKLFVNDDELRLEINHETPKIWYRQDLNDNVGFLLGGSEYYRENEHFIKSVLSGTVPISDFESAIKVDHLLDQVRRAVNE
jgi:predicted dehydrogenase